jgi:Tfp pilus assembly protein PilV
MKAILRSTAGMTLAEVVVALGIISVGLLALLATMPLSTSTITGSNLKTTATFLAQQRLEQIKNAQWCLACGAAVSAVDTLGGAGSNGGAGVAQWPDEGYNTIVIASGNTNASYPRFRREVRITDCSVASCSGIATGTAAANTLRQVTVTVSFRRDSAPVMRDTSDNSGAAAQVDLGEESVQIVTLIARRS